MNTLAVTALLYAAAACGFVTVVVLLACVVASFIRSGQISEMERKHGKES